MDFYKDFTPNGTDVRLVSTQHAWEGRAEVYIDGSWRTVCEKGFDANAARVVCRMLGYEMLVQRNNTIKKKNVYMLSVESRRLFILCLVLT